MVGYRKLRKNHGLNVCNVAGFCNTKQRFEHFKDVVSKFSCLDAKVLVMRIIEKIETFGNHILRLKVELKLYKSVYHLEKYKEVICISKESTGDEKTH